MDSTSRGFMRLLFILFPLFILPYCTKSESVLDEDVWNNVGTFCPSQICKHSQRMNTTRWCSCDNACIRYGDCCFDKVIEMNDTKEEGINKWLEDHRIQCVKIPSLGWSLVVSSCLIDNRNTSSENSRRLCSKESQIRSHILDIPVTSSLTGLTYRNVYCAVCSGDARHLLPLKATLILTIAQRTTEDFREWTYEQGSLSWKSKSQDDDIEFEKNMTREDEPFGYALFHNVEFGSGESSESHDVNKARSDMLIIKERNMNDRSYPNPSVLTSDDVSEFSEPSSDEIENPEFEKILKGRILSDRDADGIKRNSFSRETEEITLKVKAENLKQKYGVRPRLILDNEFIRRCAVTMTDSCTREDAANDIAAWCASYSMPVYLLKENEGTTTMFKNPHCAACNNVKIENVKCLNYAGDKKVKEHYETGKTVELVFSFGDALAGDQRCGLRSVWDPLFGKCHFFDIENEKQPSESKSQITEKQHESSQSIAELKPHGPEQHANRDYCEDSTLLTLTNVQWYLASAFFGVSVVCLSLYVIVNACSGKPLDNSLNETGKRQASFNSQDKKEITDRSFQILAWLIVLGQLLFIMGSRRTEVRVICVAIAVIHNFLSLAAISWLSVFCLQVFQSFFSLSSLKSVNTVGSKANAPSLKLTLIAWIIPIIFSSLCLTLELVPGNLRSCLARGGACWYGDTIAFRLLFILPALLMLAGDGCIFSAIVFGIREKREAKVSSPTRSKKQTRMKRGRNSGVAYNDYRRFRLCARLGLLMTISWSCAAIASLGGMSSVWYGFVIFSGLQGVFVFVSSGAKSKLMSILWVRATGKPLTVGENSIKNKGASNDVIPEINVQK